MRARAKGECALADGEARICVGFHATRLMACRAELTGRGDYGIGGGLLVEHRVWQVLARDTASILH